jgi:hypothetical protein
VRVTLVPPEVKEPRGHREQVLEPLELLNRLSAPQTVHVLLEASLYFPAAHVTTLLVPSHAEPLGHIVQVVRVCILLPDVNEPVGHVAQDPNPELPAYILSDPHIEHCAAPLPAYDPGRHTRDLLVPSHRLPTAHVEHVVRFEAVPPEVNEPGEQDVHVLASSRE